MKVSTRQAYPILLAGGSGTRLWPVSRSLFPKQLVKFGEKRTLIQETIQRLLPVFNLEKIMTVCGREHYHETVKQLQAIGIRPDKSIICEPAGRNTAPAVLLAAMMVGRRCGREDEDAVLFIFPADHVIKFTERFHSKIREAMRLAVEGHIVTFGIEPDYPETGYGYIEGGSEPIHGALKIKRFVEKPDLKTAEKYIASGNFYWNSGMFAFKSSIIMTEFTRFAPEMVAAMKKILAAGELSPAAYQTLPSISFDYAVMEQTEKGVVLPSDFGWSDIGSWKSLYDFLPKDAEENVIKGDVITSRTRKSLVMSQNSLIVTNDVQNMVVVETPDAVFVSSLENSREVKNIVESLKTDHRREYQSHITESYQWGSLKQLDENSRYHIATYTVRKNEIFRGMLNAGSFWHVFILRGRARLSFSNQQPLDLKPFQSQTLSAPGELALINSGDQPVEAVIIRTQKGEAE